MTSVTSVTTQLEDRLSKRRQFLADRQPTPADWDKLFHYAAAYRRNKKTNERNINEFAVSDADRAQVAQDKAKEIRQALAEDEDVDQPSPGVPASQRQQKRKRNPSPLPTPAHYTIPKRTDRGRNNQRGRTSARTPQGPPSRDSSRQDPRDARRHRPSYEEDFGQYIQEHLLQPSQTPGFRHAGAGPPRLKHATSFDQSLPQPIHKHRLRQQVLDLQRRLDRMEDW